MKAPSPDGPGRAGGASPVETPQRGVQQRGVSRPDPVDAGRLSFEPFVPEAADALVGWLCSETWPFHTSARPEPGEVRSQLENGDFTEDARVFWVLWDGMERVGLVRLEYLSEESPTADFRVREAYRGRGIGKRMVRWAAGYVFTTFPDKPRLEGQTREDNVAMRRVFERCGWVREAYYRRAWPAADGSLRGGVGYAILNDDWRSGRTTPIPPDA